MKNILSKQFLKTALFIFLLAVLVAAITIQWGSIWKTRDNNTQVILDELYRSRIADSVRMDVLNQDIQKLTSINLQLKEAIGKNVKEIERLRVERINEQYKVYQYNASSAAQYFLEETGGSDLAPEIVLRNEDTCLISPIENITEANIRFVQLDYTLEERDQYKEMSENLSEQIVNYEDVIYLKDSIIVIQEGQIGLSQKAIDEMQKNNQEAEKRHKKDRNKIYIASGAAAILGIIAILK